MVKLRRTQKNYEPALNLVTAGQTRRALFN